ncbi:MAG: 3-deoxy-8-phosphooctulonate synthase [Leptospirales bacterium]|jgi:2-dehydro-3-deoxyphosphooctonate aldolase (KDO 8-P synthase)
MIQEREFLKGRRIGGEHPFFLIAGPCVIESRDMLARICEQMLEVANELGILYIFKSSFDKANRSSSDSRRGPGIDEGLADLRYIKETFDVPLVTDLHETAQVAAVADVVDVLQIPAFLCRQTDLVNACAATGRWVNVKKGQFLAPADAGGIVDKIQAQGSEKYLITERGTSFGYNNLVFDPRSNEILHSMNIPVVMDGTHSTQLPGGGKTSGGNRQYVPLLTRTAVAAGIEGLFMEVHPKPEEAWSDASNQYWLDQAPDLLRKLYRLDRFVKSEVLPSAAATLANKPAAEA